MAELNKTVLGRLSGALGDVVFRQRNGKNYVSMRPSSYHTPENPAAVAKREKFLLSVQLGSAINSNQNLKAIWDGYTPSGLTPFNFMVRKNYDNISNGELTNRVTLAPGLGFTIISTDLNLNTASLIAELDPLGTDTGIDTGQEPNLYFSAVINLSSPVDPADKENQFLSLISPAIPVDLVNNLSINIPLTSAESNLAALYQTKKIYGILNTVDSFNNPVHFSITITG